MRLHEPITLLPLRGHWDSLICKKKKKLLRLLPVCVLHWMHVHTPNSYHDQIFYTNHTIITFAIHKHAHRS